MSAIETFEAYKRAGTRANRIYAAYQRGEASERDVAEANRLELIAERAHLAALSTPATP